MESWLTWLTSADEALRLMLLLLEEDLWILANIVDT